MKKVVPVALLVSVLMFGVAASKRPVTLYMVGDSTMADRADTTITAERGWGQVLPTFLNDKIVLKNYAKNGRSTKSYLAEGRWAEVVAQLNRGDIVIIQFGHNDTKETDSTRYACLEDYQANLELMVQQAKKKGAKPILCTPIARRYFSKETGELVNRHGGYPESVRRVAEANDVPLLDMTELTSDWLREVGKPESKQYFAHMPAGKYSKYPEGKKDNTHLTEVGAIKVAQLAAKAVVDQKIKCLAPYIVLDENAPVRYSVPVGVK